MNKRNVALDIVLTLLLCGLWNLVVQYDQIKSLNILLKEEKFSLIKLSIFSILTCGIYFIYFEYLKAHEFAKFKNQNDDSDTLIAVILSIFGMNFIFDAILQTKINEHIDQQNLMIK